MKRRAISKREAQRRFREKNRELVIQRKRNDWHKRKANPVTHARDLEQRRMRYRLLAQQQGREIRNHRSTQPERKVYLPGRPLAAAIDRLAGFSELGVVCELAGLEERQVRAWRMGERAVSFVDADRVMTALDLLWWDVWTEDTVRVPLFTVHVYVSVLKLVRGGARRRYRARDRSIPYGDAGPDLVKLSEIAAVMAGEAVAA